MKSVTVAKFDLLLSAVSRKILMSASYLSFVLVMNACIMLGRFAR